MSLYHKTQEQTYSYLTTNYVLSDEAKTKLKDELIDGEVLFELNDEDFINLGFQTAQIKIIKYTISKEKNKSNENASIDDLIKKLNSFGITELSSFLKKDLEKLDLKLGQKKLLMKYKKISGINSININSDRIEILNFFKNNLKLSDESLEVLQQFTGKFIFGMNEEEIHYLELKKEDEIKIINLIKDVKNENDKKEEKEIEEKKENNIENKPTNIEKKMKLEDMIIY